MKSCCLSGILCLIGCWLLRVGVCRLCLILVSVWLGWKPVCGRLHGELYGEVVFW